jgi:hypothetical protein
VLGRLALIRLGRTPELLGLRGVGIRLLAVARRFGGEPLSHDRPLLGSAPKVSDQGRQCDHADYDYRDDEDR